MSAFRDSTRQGQGGFEMSPPMYPRIIREFEETEDPLCYGERA